MCYLADLRCSKMSISRLFIRISAGVMCVVSMSLKLFAYSRLCLSVEVFATIVGSSAHWPPSAFAQFGLFVTLPCGPQIGL